jgi:hypothetical protein
MQRTYKHIQTLVLVAPTKCTCYIVHERASHYNRATITPLLQQRLLLLLGTIILR